MQLHDLFPLLRRRWFGLTAGGAIILTVAAVNHAQAVGIGPGAGAHPSTTCNSANPCVLDTNNGSGAGHEGLSLGGRGDVGITKFNSSLPSNGTAGVAGLDASSSGTFDAGVFGQSVRGIGVKGSSTNGNAVVAISGQGFGINARSIGSIGANIIGGYNNDKPVLSLVNNALPGDFIDACVTGIGHCVKGSSQLIYSVGSDGGVFSNASIFGAGTANQFGGVTILGFGPNSALFVSGGSPGSTPVVSVFEYQAGTDMIKMTNTSQTNIFRADDLGNVVITGLIYTAGSCSSGCAISGKPGKHVISYMARESAPNIEDTGEGRLVNGEAYVKIDPSFGSVIDRTADYTVLITPEGDSRGLYVTQKSSVGFAVRENEGGRSTLAFGYRIVAKPYGASQPRLPVVNMRREMPPPPLYDAQHRRIMP